ncbi:MAG TPA: hypothetical protein VG603_03060 [Chitinophagales bacterium]|nr:hypothetical protein [Chitinophagales bacterium]
MKSLLKFLFLPVLCLFFITKLPAQDKYDYAVVRLQPPNMGRPALYVSISGHDFQRTDIAKEEFKDNYDCTPLLNYIAKMNADGWQVTGSDFEGVVAVYFLERKKQ